MPLRFPQVLALGTALLLLAAPTPAAAQAGATRIAAVINDEVVTTQDVNDRIALVLATGGLPDTPETRRRLTPQVLRGMVDERLQLQEAERLGVRVTAADVDQALTTIAGRNRLDLTTLTRTLEERGVPVRVLRDQIRTQIAWGRVVARELRPRVAVTQAQVQFALKNDSPGGDTELLLSEIVLPVNSGQGEAEVETQARDLVATIRGGADFAALARQVSVAGSAAQSGDLGWVQTSTILPEYRERLTALPAGAVSEPIASPAGIAIFQVRAKRAPGEAVTTTRLVVERVDLAQVLFPLDSESTPAQARAADARARAARARLDSCADVARLGPSLGGEGSGRIGWLALGDMPASLRQIVTRLEPGQVSEPIQGPAGIQLLVVCDREGREETVELAPATPPPPPLTPELARGRLESEQLERLATRYLRDLRDDGFIEVRI